MDTAISIESDEIISIFNITPEHNGKKCNCICIECKRPVIAKTLGTKQRKCFAHTKNDERACKKIQEEKKNNYIEENRNEYQARNSPETKPTCIEEKQNTKITKGKTLIQLWYENNEKPFIAKRNDGYYVYVETNPKNTQFYGKLDKSVQYVKKYTHDKVKIYYKNEPIWEFYSK